MVGSTVRRKKISERKRNYIREWREFRGFASQGDLAAASGITRATISRLESGKLPYHELHLEKLAIPLKCTPGDLVTVNPLNDPAIIQIYYSLSEIKKKAALRAVKEISEGKL
jgi:DNA-binding Xre family transcriptional regulator